MVPNASNAAVVSAAVAERLAASRRPSTTPPTGRRSSRSRARRPAASWRRSRTSPSTSCRYYAIGDGARRGRRSLGRPDRLHRRGRLRAVPGQRGRRSRVWDALLARATDGDLLPCGLGARDTLRLEAGMPLYGNELDRDTTPAEAGLGRVVKLDKPGDFVGRDALAAAAARRPAQVAGRSQAARAGHRAPRLPGLSPTMAPMPWAWSPAAACRRRWAWPSRWPRCRPTRLQSGTMVEVGIRASRVAAEVVALPFYRRPG